MGLYKREQTFIIVAASLALVGAVFMLVNIFGAQEWAFWVGLGFAIASAIIFILIQIQHMQFNKKYTARESELKAKESELKQKEGELKALLEEEAHEAKAEAKVKKPETATKAPATQVKTKPSAAKPASSATKPKSKPNAKKA